MSTVAQVVGRVYRDWLYSPEDQPVVVTLASTIDSSTTTVTYSDSTLAPDEEDLLAPGVIIEFAPDGEQCRITAVDDTANSLTVTRAVNGTTAAAHTSGAEITVSPTYPRTSVIEAVKDNVVTLYPSLWWEDTETVTTSASYSEVPATVITPSSFFYVDGTSYIDGAVRLHPNFPPSSTGKAITYGASIPTGKTGYFTFRSKFARPTSTSDDLTASFGVDASWERIVAVGAAADVLGSRPVDEATSEFITEQLQREALPPGATTDIRNGLYTLRSIFLDDARRSLQAQQGVAVIYNRVGS